LADTDFAIQRVLDQNSSQLSQGLAPLFRPDLCCQGCHVGRLQQRTQRRCSSRDSGSNVEKEPRHERSLLPLHAQSWNLPAFAASAPLGFSSHCLQRSEHDKGRGGCARIWVAALGINEAMCKPGLLAAVSTVCMSMLAEGRPQGRISWRQGRTPPGLTRGWYRHEHTEKASWRQAARPPSRWSRDAASVLFSAFGPVRPTAGPLAVSLYCYYLSPLNTLGARIPIVPTVKLHCC